MNPKNTKKPDPPISKAKAARSPAVRPKDARVPFEKLIVQISTRFIALPADKVDGEIVRAQKDVCVCLGLDLSSLWEMTAGDPNNLAATHVYVPPDYSVPVLGMDTQAFFPWSMNRIARGETVVLHRLTDIPPEGARDREVLGYYRILSAITFPLSAGGVVFGAVAFDTFRKQRTWTPRTIDRLGLIAEVFANALFRKRADQELRENEARYRGLFEHSLEGISRTSPEGRVVFANPAMAQILGYDSPDEVMRSITDLASQVWAVPDDRSRFIERLEREGSIRGFECRLKRKDGSPIWVSLSVRPVRGPQGQIAYFDGFAENIDQRRSAEIGLAEGEKRYRTLFENTPAGICVVSPDGYVRTANALQARLYGYGSPQDLVGFFAPLFLAEKDRGRAADMFAALVGGEAVTGRTYTAVRRDGSEFIVEISAVSLRDPGQNVQEYLMLTRDITRSQRDAEERHQLRLERTHLSRVLTVDELSTSLAHEINQPLGAIMNNAEAARTLLSGGRDKSGDVPDIIEDIIQDAKRAGDIIRKVRRIVGKSDPQFERLSVARLIEETLEVVQNNVALNNATLRMDLAPDLPDIGGDRVRLQQVLLNLITNALDAMKDAPSRVLTLRSAMDGSDTVVVSVSDSGPGIAASQRASLFQPFVTTKKGGMGLGLSICRSIIEEHGGRIYAASEPGRGATFSFSLKAWRDSAG